MGSLGRKARTDDFAKVLFSVKTIPISQHCLITEGSSASYGSKIISGERHDECAKEEFLNSGKGYRP